MTAEHALVRKLVVISRAGWIWDDMGVRFQDNDGRYLDSLASLFDQVEILTQEFTSRELPGVKYGYRLTNKNVQLFDTMGPFRLSGMLLSLARLQKASVVFGFVNTLRGCLYVLLATWGFRKPTIVYNGTDWQAALIAERRPLISRVVRLWLERLAMAAADVRIVTGPRLFARFCGFGPTHMAVPISSVLDAMPSVSCPPVNVLLRVLCVAHLRRDKNIDVLLKACARLSEQGHRFEFTIVGDGAMRKELELLCESLGLQEQVRFIGYVNDPQQLAQHYAAAQVFLFASTVEGFPRAVWEAVYFGLYVVMAKVGGVEQVFDNSDMRILEKPCPQEFANAVAEIAREPEKCKQAADSARRKVQALFGNRDPVAQFRDCLGHLERS